MDYAKPGSPAYGEVCAGFDLLALPTPELAVTPPDEAGIVEAVRFAAAHGLPVSARATGHGTGIRADAGLVISTRALTSVVVDPQLRTARIGGGATWDAVLPAVGPTGLAPLCGSAPGVGVAGYALGGGIGVFARRFGFAADHVRRIRLVTATGALVDVTAEREPDLFWAVRGAGSSFGIATEIEIGLVPVPELYGGGLYFPGESAPELLGAFRAATETAPEELSLSVAVLTFPDLPAVPEELRGRFTAHLRVAWLGTPAEVEPLLAPLRGLGEPVLDTVRPMPVTAVGSIHGDPVAPQPVSSRSTLLPGWAGVEEAVLDAVGPGTPFMLEIRHLGGALARPADPPNAVGGRDALLNLFTSAYPGPGIAEAGRLQVALHDRFGPDRRVLATFAGGPEPDEARVFDAEPLARLRALQEVWDPERRFRFGVLER